MPASRHSDNGINNNNNNHHYHHQQQQQQQQQANSASAVSAVAVAAAAAAVAQTIKEKQRLCTNCKNHGLRKVWKKHKRYCKYRDCRCEKCKKTAATRKNCAEQTAKRRARQEDEQREQELQLNPANFMDERPIPYPAPVQADALSSSVTNYRSIEQLSAPSLAAASSTTKASSSRTSEYDDSSSIDIGGGSGGGGLIAERSAVGGGLVGGAGDMAGYVDIDADSRPAMMSDQIENVKTILKELIGRTKDFQNLNAFRLFVLQHSTYDVDKATKSIKRAHEEFKFLDLMSEKSETNVIVPAVDEKPIVLAVQQPTTQQVRNVNRLPSLAAVGLHQLQLQQQSHNNRTTSGGGGGGGGCGGGAPGLVVTDYRGEPVTGQTVVLDPVGTGGSRRTVLNGSVSGAICGGGELHHSNVAVLYPRPIYPFGLPLPSATALWHHSQPPFPAPNATFSPFIESEWSRHCRLPIFNPEPMNLQSNNHHRRAQLNHRVPEIAERLERVHNRPQPVNLQQDDREQTRHHA